MGGCRVTDVNLVDIMIQKTKIRSILLKKLNSGFELHISIMCTKIFEVGLRFCQQITKTTFVIFKLVGLLFYLFFNYY
jgi:hypothetical protein